MSTIQSLPNLAHQNQLNIPHHIKIHSTNIEEDPDDYYYPLEPEEIEYTTPTPTTATKVAPLRGLRDPYDPRLVN